MDFKSLRLLFYFNYLIIYENNKFFPFILNLNYIYTKFKYKYAI